MNHCLPRQLSAFFLFSLLAIFVGCKALHSDSSVKILRGPRLPIGIFEMGYATDGKIIFSIGGTTFLGSHEQSVGEIYLYSPFAGGWHKGRFTNKPVVKGPTNSVYMPNFNIVLSAGFTEIQKSTYYTFPLEIIDLNNYQIDYHHSNPHWSQGSDVVYWNKKAYIFGGIILEEDASTHFSNRLLSYDLIANEWQDLRPMPSARTTYGTVVGNNLYTFGGFDTENSYADIWRYDFEADTWETVGYLPYPVSHFSIAVRYPYVFLCNVGNEKNIIGRVDIRDGSFREFKTWITVTSAGSAIVGDHLYIFGGTWDDGKTASNKTFKIPMAELMSEK